MRVRNASQPDNLLMDSLAQQEILTRGEITEHRIRKNIKAFNQPNTIKIMEDVVVGKKAKNVDS